MLAIRGAGVPALGVAEFDPGGRMVARLVPPPDVAVHTGGGEAAGGRGVEQQVVDPQPGVAPPGAPCVVPECVYPSARVQVPQRVRPPWESSCRYAARDSGRNKASSIQLSGRYTSISCG